MRPDVQSWQSTAGDEVELSSVTMGSAHGWLANPAIILGLIGLYLLGHFLLRLALSPTLGIDDAEQVLFAQHWAFGYRFRQPPLFTWALLPVIDVVGPGVLAISLVRYGFLAITYLFLYLTARRCLCDQRMAGLAVLSFALIYVFAYYAHHDLTHTTALGAMIALCFYVVVRMTAAPTWPTYFLLGLVFGLGMLAKWNFAMLAIGLPLTCLAFPTFRQFVISWKVLATIGVMTVVLTPTALWMFAHGQSVQGVSSEILSHDGSADQATLALEGGVTLLRSIILFPMPFLLIFLAFFGRSVRDGLETPLSPSDRSLTPAFFGCLILIILALHALLIPLFGAVNFTERWLHPALLILPIFLFMLAEDGRQAGRRITVYLAIIAILVAAAAGARLYRYAAGVDDCGKCREFAPFAELAEELRAAGFSRGTIIADGMHIGGNLKMLFADSQVIDPAFPLVLWPKLDEAAPPGDCLLVWRDEGEPSASRRDVIRDFAISELDLKSAPSPKANRIDAPLLGSSTRRYALGFELYRENAGGCR